MKGKSRSNPTSPASPLHQVGFAGKHRCIVCHVVVCREHLHLVLSRVDHKHHILNGDTGLRYIGGKDDLESLSSKYVLKVSVDIITFVTPSGTLPKTAL